MVWKLVTTLLVLISLDSVRAGGRLFEGPGSFPIEAPASATVVDDLDGDGHLDVAATLESTGRVTVLFRGDGGNVGGFVESISLEVGLSPLSIVTANLNGDDLPDLVVVNSGSSTLSLLVNEGERSFRNGGEVRVGTNPRVTASGDFNLDGVSDVATSNLLSSDIRIHLGDGEGGLRPGPSIFVGDNPHSLVVNDFDGDDHDDVVVINSLSRRQGMLSFFRSNGDGDFDAAVRTELGVRGDTIPRFLAAGHFNADERLDVAVLTDELEVHSFLNLGKGRFEARLVNEPTEQRFTPSFLVAADWDGDGFDDIITPIENGLRDAGVRVFAGRRTGSFAEPFDRFFGEGIRSLEILDFDADAIDDLLVAWNETPEVSIFSARAPGDLLGRLRVPLPTAPLDVAILEENLDGRDGILTMTHDAFFEISRVSRRGASRPLREPYDAGTLVRFELVDLDGDGRRDVAALDGLNSSLLLRFRSPQGGFTQERRLDVAPLPLDLQAGDFDENGIPDIAVTSRADDLTIILNPAGATLSSRTDLIEIGSRQTSLSVADFDGDGHEDLGVGARNGVVILLGDGAGGFPRRVELEEFRASPGIAFADLDGDGEKDIALIDGDELVVFPSTVSNLFQREEPVRSVLPDAGRSISIHQAFGEDEEVRIVVTSFELLFILRARGGGAVEVVEQYRLGRLPAATAFDDLNGDGSIDCVSADQSSQGLSVLFGCVFVEPGSFRRGDANGDSRVSITDPVVLLEQLFRGGPVLACEDANDTNDDGLVNLADAIAVLLYLFQGAGDPVAPGAFACGLDETADKLAACETDCTP